MSRPCSSTRWHGPCSAIDCPGGLQPLGCGPPPSRLTGNPMPTTFTLNGKSTTLDADPDMPLLWAVREVAGLPGTKFGCGIAMCGACTVHLDGVAIRSCVMPLASVAGRQVTTIEGLEGSPGKAVQAAWIKLQVPQCGYCQSGQIMSATALLSKSPAPTDADIDAAMSGNICRCAHVFPHTRRDPRSRPNRCRREHGDPIIACAGPRPARVSQERRGRVGRSAHHRISNGPPHRGARWRSPAAQRRKMPPSCRMRSCVSTATATSP